MRFLVPNRLGFPPAIFLGMILGAIGAASAAELGEGTITALLPTVQKMNGGSSEIVSVGDKITAGGQIQTQAQAVAEITFPDGSKIRIGNNSTFSFDPNDRTVRLDRGSALVCTPPAAEGINIVSGGVSGAVAGDPAGKTFLVTAYPADGSGGKTAGATGGFGLVVLQGNAATTVAAPSGSVTIAPGQLAVIGANGGAPSLHTVDLGQVIRSTPLIGGFPTPLPTTGAILNTAIGQQTQISRGVLSPTGTSGVAITFGGQLLTAASPPPNPAPPSFVMAISTPGFNGNLTGVGTASQLANINTAGGGGGSGPFGGLTPSGVTGGGGGGSGGPTVPGSINTPNNTGQQGVSANPTPLSAVASVTTKVYDGTTSAGLTGAAPSGPANNVSLGNATTGTFASKNAGSGISVTTGMTLIGAGASLYNFTTPTLTGTILPKDITMTSSTVNKVYDGTTAAAVTLGTLSGLVGAEQLQVSVLGGSGTFSSPNVGGSSSVSVTYQLADDLASGGLIANYNLLNPTETLNGTISAKDLQVFSAAVTTKVYDGTDSAVVTGAVLVGNSTAPNDGKYIGTETVTLSGGTSGTFADKNVGTGKTVTTAMTLGGADAGNYTLSTQPILTGAITVKTVTIDASAPSGVVSKVYDGGTAATVTVGALLGVVAGETLGATTAVGTFTDKNIGTKNVTAVYTLVDGVNPAHLASNYTLANETLTGTITAKDLQVFSAAVTTKVYDGTDSAVVTGAVLVGNSTADNDGKFIGSETVTLSGGTSGTFADKNVGTGKTVTTAMTLGGADAGNYTLSTQPVLTGAITAKTVTIDATAPSGVVSKVYDGGTAATVTVGALLGVVAGETLGVTTAVGTFADKNVGTGKNVAAVYTLVDGVNPAHLASNYTIAGETLTGDITAKPLSITAPTIAPKVYDGQVTAGAVTVGALSGFVGSETVTASGTAASYSSANVGTYNSVPVTYTLANGSNGGLAGNYSLAADTATGAIVAKDLQVFSGVVTARKYDGTTDAVITGAVLVGNSTSDTDGKFIASEAVTLGNAGTGTFASKDVGNRGVTTAMTLGGADSGNYTLSQPGLTGAITEKDLVVNGGGITVSKAYNNSTAINAGTDVVIASSALTGGSTGPSDGKYIGTENVTLAVDSAGTFERILPGTMIPISTTVKLASGNAVNGNYTLRAQPTGLTGEITGSATLNQNGAALNASTGSFLHVRNTTASRMQDGMTFQTTVGEVLIENSSFDGWMQRSTPNTKIDDGGAVTFQFTESAGVLVNSPVLRIKMEANDPTADPATNLDYMLLGDYQMQIRHDPDGIASNGDESSTSVFSFPGKASDPSGIGSLAPAADLVVRDTASTEFKDLVWDAKEYSSLDSNGEAVDSGNYATATGEYQPDGSATMSDLDTPTAAGKWDVTVSDPALGGEGKVTDLRLKYNNNTKVLIEGPDGVRLLNVKLEGMDGVDVRTTDLNNRVLMSATLLNDPDITKMVVKASQTLEAVLKSDATFQQVKSMNNADLLAGVVRDPASPTGFTFVAGAERALAIDGPGAAAATPNVNITGQLAIAAHTVVFNNANISSGGVIGVRTRDGMVNRTYGTVVPGTTSFMGLLGNKFVNTANSQSMAIGSSADITGAFTGGKLTDFGSGGTGTVMSVGKVQ